MAIHCSKGHRMKCLYTRQTKQSVARRYACTVCSERKSTHEYLDVERPPEVPLTLDIRRRLTIIIDEAVKLLEALK